MARRRIGFDRSAYAFAVAARLTDSTQIRAVNALTIGTKFDGVWPLIQVLYPFVGGTAASHGVNLRGPQNSVIWSGGVTHSELGVTGDGLTGWGETNFSFSGLGASFHAAAAYTGAGVGGNGAALYGALNSVGVGVAYYPTRFENGGGIMVRSGVADGLMPGAQRPAGVSIISRISGTQYQHRFGGVTQVINSTYQFQVPGSVALLGVKTNDTIGARGTAQMRFFCAGSGLSAPLMAALDGHILAYNQATGRAI